MLSEPGSLGPLRIAVVHSFYSSRQPSGENVVVDLQVDALRAAGHQVELFARRTDDLEQSRLYPLWAAARVATGRGADPVREIDDFAPDVVHVHNLFPNFGRAWVRRYADRLVATMHNFRPLCPAGTLFRDGHLCTLCPDGGSARPAVKYACYKDSKVATLPVALGTRFADDPLLANAARIFTLNSYMSSAYEGVGVPAERLVTVPNFVRSDAGAGQHDGGFWLFVGRLSHEKGILPVVASWPEGRRLVVVGSGPLSEDVTTAAGPNVELRGQLPNDEVRRLLGRAEGLVFPSIWPEGLPTVYLEALASGTPVLASHPSVVARLVEEQGTGLAMSGSPESHLAGDLERAAAAFPGMRERCRATYDANYTEDAWVRNVEREYRTLGGTG